MMKIYMTAHAEGGSGAPKNASSTQMTAEEKRVYNSLPENQRGNFVASIVQRTRGNR